MSDDFLCRQCQEQRPVLGEFCWECQRQQQTFVLQPTAVLPAPPPRDRPRYLPTLGELVDRLSIAQLKAWKIGGPDYAREIRDIRHDIALAVDRWSIVDFDQTTREVARVIHGAVVCALINAEIWHNEGAVRAGTETLPDAEVLRRLKLTHGLNGVRSQAKNHINAQTDERQDGKVDCLAAEFQQWTVQWDTEEDA